MRYVIVVAAMLVEGDQQQRLIPTRAIAQSLVDIVDQLLAQRHIVIRMLAVAPAEKSGSRKV